MQRDFLIPDLEKVLTPELCKQAISQAIADWHTFGLELCCIPDDTLEGMCIRPSEAELANLKDTETCCLLILKILQNRMDEDGLKSFKSLVMRALFNQEFTHFTESDIFINNVTSKLLEYKKLLESRKDKSATKIKLFSFWAQENFENPPAEVFDCLIAEKLYFANQSKI